MAAVVLALLSIATAVLPAAATGRGAGRHRLIVVVKKNLAPAAERKLAVLVLINQGAGAPAGALASASKPLTILLDSRGPYRVKAEVDAACKGSCSGSSRISGSADHKLEIVPVCRPRGSGFVCSSLRIVKVY